MKPLQVLIIHNSGEDSRYRLLGEELAAIGVKKEASAVAEALRGKGHAVEILPLQLPLRSIRRHLSKVRESVIFNLYQGDAGRPGLEWKVAQLLEALNVTCTGAPSECLRISLDKALSKDILLGHGIPTPKFQIFRIASSDVAWGEKVSFPLVVKPVAEDGSHGVRQESVVCEPESLERRLRWLLKRYPSGALVEEFLPGREFHVTVLGNRHLEPLEISEVVYTRKESGFWPILDYDAKWKEDSDSYRQTPVHCPVDIDSALREGLIQCALATYRVLGCRGFGRVDMRLDASGRPNVLEFNPNPDLSLDAATAYQAEGTGIEYADMIEKILFLALEGKEDGRRVRVAPFEGAALGSNRSHPS